MARRVKRRVDEFFRGEWAKWLDILEADEPPHVRRQGAPPDPGEVATELARLGALGSEHAGQSQTSHPNNSQTRTSPNTCSHAPAPPGSPAPRRSASRSAPIPLLHSLTSRIAAAAAPVQASAHTAHRGSSPMPSIAGCRCCRSDAGRCPRRARSLVAPASPPSPPSLLWSLALDCCLLVTHASELLLLWPLVLERSLVAAEAGSGGGAVRC